MATNTAIYQPKFSDDRIIRRTRRVLQFVDSFVKTPKPLAQNILRKHFGNTARNLGKYLLENTLIVVDPTWNMTTGECKKYKRNKDGIAKIQACLKQAGINPTPQISPDLKQQLKSGEFKTTEKSDRSFHELQYWNKPERTRALNEHGYRYEYDLVAAAPTLLLQQAKRLNPAFEGQFLMNYCTNRSEIRALVARDCGITCEQAKTVINAIINGGVVTSWSKSSLFHQLDSNYDAVKKLNNHPLVQDLKQDIKEMWAVLRSEFETRYYTNKNGVQVTKRISASEKSEYYRKLEMQVMKQVLKLFRKKGKAFHIHDGWAASKLIDPSDVITHVRITTGFNIKIDLVIYDQYE